MKKLQWHNNQALTPFGIYQIQQAKTDVILTFPDKTCRVFTSEAAARYYGNVHWLALLASALERPLHTLYSTPGIWREGIKDRTYTLYHLSGERFNLCEAIAVCYPHQQEEIQNILKLEIAHCKFDCKNLTELNNKGIDFIRSVIDSAAL